MYQGRQAIHFGSELVVGFVRDSGLGFGRYFPDRSVGNSVAACGHYLGFLGGIVLSAHAGFPGFQFQTDKKKRKISPHGSLGEGGRLRCLEISV